MRRCSQALAGRYARTRPHGPEVETEISGDDPDAPDPRPISLTAAIAVGVALGERSDRCGVSPHTRSCARAHARSPRANARMRIRMSMHISIIIRIHACVYAQMSSGVMDSSSSAFVPMSGAPHVSSPLAFVSYRLRPRGLHI